MNDQTQTQQRWTRFWQILTVVAIALSTFATTMATLDPFAPEPAPIPTPAVVEQPEQPILDLGDLETQAVGIYRTGGGQKMIAPSGTEIEILQGATLDIQDGSTFNFDGDLSSSTGAFTVADTLNVTGAADFDSTVNIDGNLASATGALTVADTLNVTGAADFDSTVNIDGNLASATGALTIADTLNVTGAADFDSTVNIDGNLASATGALTIADTLNVTGAADFDDTLNVDGATTAVTITLSSDIINTPQTTFVVEAGVPITPTGYYQPISSTAGVDLNDVSNIAAPDDDTIGKLLEIHNLNATLPITIDGTGADVECKSDVVLGPGDIAGLRWNGDDWNCRYVYDNS